MVGAGRQQIAEARATASACDTQAGNTDFTPLSRRQTKSEA